MILVDFNQIAIGSVMVALNRGEELSETLVRHLILNGLRYYRSRFYEKYDELIICCDSKHYWRRDYFPNYKINRKKERETTGHDWNVIFNCLNNIRDELKETFPYKVLEIYGAEADDIIATLVMNVADKEDTSKHLILSSDKDFIQLHRFGIDQFSPVAKKMINNDDPVNYLREHILKGDRSDGIPNILSPDDSFISNIRQKPMRKVVIGNITEALDRFPPDKVYQLAKCSKDTWVRNWQRNETLIDLGKIPKDIMSDISKEYNSVNVGNRANLLTYFIENKLTQLIESIGDF
jgi:5'-3' exonuclease